MKMNFATITTLDLLGFIFIVLKLLKIIDWAWWIVLLPILGPPILSTIIFFIVVFIWGTIGVICWIINQFK